MSEFNGAVKVAETKVKSALDTYTRGIELFNKFTKRCCEEVELTFEPTRWQKFRGKTTFKSTLEDWMDYELWCMDKRGINNAERFLWRVLRYNSMLPICRECLITIYDQLTPLSSVGGQQIYITPEQAEFVTLMCSPNLQEAGIRKVLNLPKEEF